MFRGCGSKVLLPEPIALQFQFPVGTAQYLHAAALLGLIRMFYGLVPEESRQYTMYLKARAPMSRPLPRSFLFGFLTAAPCARRDRLSFPDTGRLSGPAAGAAAAPVCVPGGLVCEPVAGQQAARCGCQRIPRAHSSQGRGSRRRFWLTAASACHHDLPVICVVLLKVLFQHPPLSVFRPIANTDLLHVTNYWSLKSFLSPSANSGSAGAGPVPAVECEPASPCPEPTRQT